MTVLAILGGLILALAVGGIILGLTSFFSVKEAVVPDLTNMTEQQAKEALEAVGLTLEVSDTVPNKDVPAGQVIKQEPKANQKNKLINPVRVTISKGPRKVIVPSLIGQSYDKVDLMLEKDGLVEGELTQEYSDYPNGIVFKQSIEPGTEVDEGQKIDYTISIGPQKFLMPNYVGKNIDEVSADLIEKDLIRGNISHESSSVYAKDTIIIQSITPGTEVNRKAVVDFVVSSGNSNVTDSDAKKTLNLQIKLPSGKDRMRVTVQRIQNNVIETVYDAYHSSAQSPINVPVSGQGKTLFEIYIDNALAKSYEYDFK